MLALLQRPHFRARGVRPLPVACVSCVHSNAQRCALRAIAGTIGIVGLAGRGAVVEGASTKCWQRSTSGAIANLGLGLGQGCIHGDVVCISVDGFMGVLRHHSRCVAGRRP